MKSRKIYLIKNDVYLTKVTPFVIARHFHFKVQIFFKEVVLFDPLEKAKYYALLNEEVIRVYLLLFGFQMLQLLKMKMNIQIFLERSVSAVLPDPLTDQNFFNLQNSIRYILIQERPGNIIPFSADFLILFSFQIEPSFQNHQTLDYQKWKRGRHFRLDTAGKVSKYGVFSGRDFPVFGLNTDQKILHIWTLFKQWEEALIKQIKFIYID